MKKESDYIIQFKGLKDGMHQFNYSVDSSFFSLIEDSLYDDGNITVKLMLNKGMNMLVLDFNINGTIKSVCDNCLEPVDVKVKTNETIYIKFGETYDDSSEEIIILPHNEHEINISKILYDFIVTSLPIRHLHETDNKGALLCNPEMIKKLNEYKAESRVEHKNEADPRWNELKKIFDKTN